MKKSICLIPGDGIGPDVIDEAVKVLSKVAQKFNHEFEYKKILAGGAAIDAFGEPLPDSELEKALSCDAVLLGAVGGAKWDSLPSDLRPERALLKIRSRMNVFANLRPARMFRQLKSACPLKDSIVENGLDILIVRELTGGIYFGERGVSPDGTVAWDTEKYSVSEIERILRIGFESARKRKKVLTLVDKANILSSSQLWRKVCENMKDEYKDVTLNYLYVDNAAMQLVRNPNQFDVIVTSNMFGDILSDEASQITGSIGMLSSASLGEKDKPGLYEPIHGSAPDIAGLNIANPLATILSCAMMLSFSFGLEEEASCIEKACEKVLDAGYRTKDIAGSDTPESKIVGTKEMGSLVADAM